MRYTTTLLASSLLISNTASAAPIPWQTREGSMLAKRGLLSMVSKTWRESSKFWELSRPASLFTQVEKAKIKGAPPKVYTPEQLKTQSRNNKIKVGAGVVFLGLAGGVLGMKDRSEDTALVYQTKQGIDKQNQLDEQRSAVQVQNWKTLAEQRQETFLTSPQFLAYRKAVGEKEKDMRTPEEKAEARKQDRLEGWQVVTQQIQNQQAAGGGAGLAAAAARRSVDDDILGSGTLVHEENLYGRDDGDGASTFYVINAKAKEPSLS